MWQSLVAVQFGPNGGVKHPVTLAPERVEQSDLQFSESGLVVKRTIRRDAIFCGRKCRVGASEAMSL